ncbi:hypothetical protein BGZ81_000366 [Podila clonocystis]|nr:hypothetical protein BGZ81_000366 [Podila clonocystis]
MVMMTKLYHNSSGEDVTFICDEAVTGSDQIRWHTHSPQKQKPTFDESVDAGGKSENSLEPNDTKGSNSTVVSATRRFGARKIVFSPNPYFKSMFSSEIAEGRSGNVEIRVKDINAETFLKTLFFMYHDELVNPLDLIFDSEDPAEAEWSSWE